MVFFFPYFKKIYNFTRNFKLSFKKLIFHNYVINSSILIKKKVFNEIGKLDESNCLTSVEDYDYWLKILNFRDKSGLFIKKPLLYYRIHNQNISRISKNNNINLFNSNSDIKRFIQIFKKYNSIYQKEIIHSLNYKRIQQIIFKYTSNYYNKKDNFFSVLLKKKIKPILKMKILKIILLNFIKNHTISFIFNRLKENLRNFH